MTVYITYTGSRTNRNHKSFSNKSGLGSLFIFISQALHLNKAFLTLGFMTRQLLTENNIAFIQY